MVSKSRTGKAKLLGITSWGFGCADKNYPGVYTKVSDFGYWIIDTISSMMYEIPRLKSSGLVDVQ